MYKDGVIAFKGRRSFWSKFFAAWCFTFGLICIYYIASAHEGFSENYQGIISWAFIGLGCFAAGRYFARTLAFEIDLEGKRYRSQSKNLFFRREGQWKYFNYVDFVSIQKIGRRTHKVNIWFNKKRNTLSAKFNSYDAAITFGKKATNYLETKFFDHTKEDGKVSLFDD